MASTDTIRERLFLRRRELLARYQSELQRIEEELSQHQTEQVEEAAEQWDVQLLSKLGDTDVRSIAAVVAALERLDRGTYGTCARCDEEIASARLHALPETALCLDCASEPASTDVVA